MAGKYATQTSVSVEKSKSEIEETLRRYGADSFASAWNRDRAMIQFDMNGRRIQFNLPIPDRGDPEFTHRIDARGYTKARTAIQAEAAWEQACRSSWRSLLLVIKATLEAVEAEIIAFEVAFLPYTVLPGGGTVADHIGPQIDQVYESGVLSGPITLALGSGS